MYYPYFRGKQFELITIREMAGLLAHKRFVPIIEPVRESLDSLERTLTAINEANGQAIIVVNPYYGDHQGNGASITELFEKGHICTEKISAGILLRSNMTMEDVMGCYERHSAHRPVLVHAGFTDPKALAAEFNPMQPITNIFLEDHAKLLYRKHFTQGESILVRDGFKRQRNADYPEIEEFSDLHVTYDLLKANGFGDFLTVGDVYSEGGGPAYAVAIHITFIDPNKDDVMYIYHFISDTKDTPTDPAGKFAQALDKLIKKLDSSTSYIHETEAVQQFRDLHAKRHFPGLGYVKKLSMKHHIELLAHYIK